MRRGHSFVRVALGALVVAALVAAPRHAAAHSQPYSFVDLKVDHGALHGSVTAHVVDLAHEAGLPDPEALLAPGFAAAHAVALERVVDAHFHLRADDRAVRPTFGALGVVPEKRSIRFDWTSDVHDPATLELDDPLFPYDPAHQTYANVYRDGALVHQDLIDHDNTRSTCHLAQRQSVAHVVETFVLEGIHHIFIGPDHILFVIGLLLLGGSIFRLLKIVSSFTVAHTITLVLAALKIVNPPSRIVEPAIALSIVFIGIETLIAMRRGRDARARIAFCFGLVHGFGFASVLRDFGLPSGALGWALGSFNVGVEIGQACIVLAAAPVLMSVRNLSAVANRRLTVAMSFGIIVAGTYWLVQRLMAA